MKKFLVLILLLVSSLYGYGQIEVGNGGTVEMGASVNGGCSSSPCPVNQGGTGATSFTPYSLLFGGTTSTSSFQSLTSLGNAGQALISGGASILPSFGTLGIAGGGTGANSQSSAFTNIVSPGGTITGSITSPIYKMTQNLPGATIKADGSGFSVGSGYYQKSGLILYGDSITAGVGASSPQYSYASILGAAWSNPFLNVGTLGSYSTDTGSGSPDAPGGVYKVSNPTMRNNIAITLMIGTNDANYCGVSAPVVNCEANYTKALISQIGWLAIPAEYKIQP